VTARLTVENVSVTYGGHEAVSGVSFSVARGQIACLLGPSGCGKTSLLRAVAGFEPLTAGRVLLDGVEASRPGFTLSPQHRRVGVVFQDYALFPHLTTTENIAYGLRGLDRARRKARVDGLLRLVGLTHEQNRYPHELSGGQQQRVALARALAPEPTLLLIDEPFSSLDVTLRERLALELRQILKTAGATAILVTHDQQEAFAMADEIGVLRAGRLQQWANAETLYQHPANRFVAAFIGPGALLTGVVDSDGVVRTGAGPAGHCQEAASGERVSVVTRPHQVRLEGGGAANATVERRVFRGADALYTLRLDDGERVLAVAPADAHHVVGARLRVTLTVDQAVHLKE
jgi:iron(III) transport system ATP-binding protein